MQIQTPQSGTRKTLQLVSIVAGVLLLLFMPLTLLYFAFSHTANAHLPGTLVILSSVGGMVLVSLGAILRD